MTIDENLRTKRLEQLMAATDGLIESMKFSAHGDDIWRFGAYYEFMCIYNNLVDSAAGTAVTAVPVFKFDTEKIPSQNNTTAFAQKKYFDSVLAQAHVFRAVVQQNLGLHKDVASDLANFTKANLRRGVHREPENERQVQDALETLLVGKGLQKGLDYDRETGRVKVSVKESTPDFIFPRSGLALEVKLLTPRRNLGRVVDEINADIRAYGTKYSSLLFVVYDLGQVQDEEEFRRGLESAGRTKVVVVKH